MKMMGEAARIRLEQLFDVSKNTQRTASILRKVASVNLNGNGFTYNKMFPEATRIKEKRQRTV